LKVASMAEPERPAAADELGDRLARARKQAGLEPEEPGTDYARQGRELSQGWRISIELVVALVVSTGLGWLLDQWWGTTPWAMIVMLVLGAAAGVNNAVKAALRMDADAARRARGGEGPKGG